VRINIHLIIGGHLLQVEIVNTNIDDLRAIINARQAYLENLNDESVSLLLRLVRLFGFFLVALLHEFPAFVDLICWLFTEFDYADVICFFAVLVDALLRHAVGRHVDWNVVSFNCDLGSLVLIESIQTERKLDEWSLRLTTAEEALFLPLIVFD